LSQSILTGMACFASIPHEVSVPVELTGTFFKVRSYRDSGEGVSHSPVVIARKIDSAISAQDPEKEAPPGVMFSAIWFAGIAAVATGLAVVIFRSSNKRSRSPGRSTTQRTHRSLEMLEQDSSIKSPAQRVAELAEDETSDSDEGVEEETDQ